MFRTAVVTTSTDDVNLYSEVLTQWEAARFSSAVPSCTVTKLHRVTVDVSAACWIMFCRDATVPADVFHLAPGDAMALIVADAGLSVRTSGSAASDLRVTRDDSSSPVTVRITAEVST